MASNTAITPESLFGEARENWGWLLALAARSADSRSAAEQPA
jgi:hypothetical protein